MEDDENINTKPSSIKSLVADIGSNRRRHNQPQLLHKEKLGSSASSIEEEDDDDEKIEKVVEDSSSKEEIIKELKNIQRQNSRTHYLLTASILINLAWKLSQYSLIWKIKQGFNNPLKSIKGAIKGIFNTIPQNKDRKHQIQLTPPTYLPGLKIPDLPCLDTSNDDDDDGE